MKKEVERISNIAYEQIVEVVKECNICKRILPLTSQYFYHFKYSKDGFKSSCKECQGGNFVKKEPSNIPDGYKKCCDCKQILPKNEKHFLKYQDKRCAGRYYLKPHCIECGKKRSKRWRENNPDKYKKYYSNYHRSEIGRSNQERWRKDNPDKVRSNKQRYRKNNREKIAAYDHKKRIDPKTRKKVLKWCKNWRANNTDRVSEYNRQYAKQNPEYFSEAAKKRADRIAVLENNYTLNDWKFARAFFNNSCAYCGDSVKDLTHDHFIPVIKGGAYIPCNIIPCCRNCNSAKHDSDFFDWYKDFKHYNPIREKRIIEFIQKKGN